MGVIIGNQASVDVPKKSLDDAAEVVEETSARQEIVEEAVEKPVAAKQQKRGRRRK